YNFLRKVLFIKSSVWNYEKEYRIVKNGFAKRKLHFQPEMVKEIIFGCKMDHEIKIELLKLIETVYPESNVFEMQLHRSKFQLEKLQIR
ncbi:MAG: hypothetical protein MI810_17255, partial [Flavobacteriales bacterium]|nr:hypothetical protein [Flavobacteriales bacterium]